jgi:hypothetical protein
MVVFVSLTQRPFTLASATSETCWLCDRERGQLCHVHEPLVEDDDSDTPEVAWAVAPAETD